jgi:GxxExxY protein
MEPRQQWAIIRSIKMNPVEKQRIKEEKAAERERIKAEKEAEKERIKAEKRMEREAKKAAKALEKASQPPKPRGRPPRALEPVIELSEVPPVPAMAPYPKADLIRSLAEEVYQALGAGHLESVYHRAMEVQLRLANLPYESERVMDLKFKDHFVGVIRADIILGKGCVLEFKISGKMDDAVQQARQYMKLQGLSHGFVVLFPKTDGAAVKMIDARMPDALDL